MIVFLDTEFTNLIRPRLLSLGLVSLDCREHYVELDLSSETGQARRNASSDFVRYEGVLGLWGQIPGATATDWEMGRRTGEWLLQLAEESGTRVEIAFDYPVDFELLEYVIRDSGLWGRVRKVVTPVNVGALTGSPEGAIAAEECFRQLRKRGLSRHHALADALALRASYVAIKALALQVARRNPVRESDFEGAKARAELLEKLTRLLEQSGDIRSVAATAAWLDAWLDEPLLELRGATPAQALRSAAGRRQVETLMERMRGGLPG